MKKPRLLDLFCCAGGAGMGYARAGFEITGVDVVRHKNNPHEVIEADALALAEDVVDILRSFQSDNFGTTNQHAIQPGHRL